MCLGERQSTPGNRGVGLARGARALRCRPSHWLEAIRSASPGLASPEPADLAPKMLAAAQGDGSWDSWAFLHPHWRRLVSTSPWGWKKHLLTSPQSLSSPSQALITPYPAPSTQPSALSTPSRPRRVRRRTLTLAGPRCCRGSPRRQGPGPGKGQEASSSRDHRASESRWTYRERIPFYITPADGCRKHAISPVQRSLCSTSCSDTQYCNEYFSILAPSSAGSCRKVILKLKISSV